MARFAAPLLVIAALLVPAPVTAQGSAADTHAGAGEGTDEGGGALITAQLGAGSLRGWNFASISYEVFPGDQEVVGLFAVAGLGTILAGVGAAVYSNLHGSGLTASAVAGLTGAHVNLGGRFGVGRVGFLTAGVGYGSYFLQHHGFMPYLSWERPF